MKVAVYIGHTPKGDKGAHSKHLGLSEYDYNIKVGQELSKLDSTTYDIFSHTIQDYYSRQVSMAEKVKNYDVVIELHFNAAGETANGTEMLHFYNSKNGKQLSKILAKNVSEKFGTKLRGVEGAKALVNKNDRGYWFVKLPKPVAVIFEPFFGSNEEALKFKNPKDLAQVIHQSIGEYCLFSKV